MEIKIEDVQPGASFLRVNRKVDTSERILLTKLVKTRNRMILEEVVPLVEASIRKQLFPLILKEKQDADEQQDVQDEWQTQVEEMRQAVAELANINEEKRKQILQLKTQLEMLRLMPTLAQQKKELKRQMLKQKTLENQIIETQLSKELYENFEEKKGIFSKGLLAQRQHEDEEQDENVYMSFFKVNPHFPEDPYHVFFSSFQLTQTGVLFTPSRADPTFVEFENLIKEYDNSTDLKGFTTKLCEYWKRDIAQH